MNVAKGPHGFNVIIKENVQLLVDDICANHPEFPRHWRAVVARLKASGHIAGSAVDGVSANRVGVFQPFANGPLFRLAWRVLGDTITVVLAEF